MAHHTSTAHHHQKLLLKINLSFSAETISEGKAKLAYQPRDKKFLSLKKGDVVLVKGKKAGSKTDLWGGQVRLTLLNLLFYFADEIRFATS